MKKDIIAGVIMFVLGAVFMYAAIACKLKQLLPPEIFELLY